jgi:hypothetical protein
MDITKLQVTQCISVLIVIAHDEIDGDVSKLVEKVQLMYGTLFNCSALNLCAESAVSDENVRVFGRDSLFIC